MKKAKRLNSLLVCTLLAGAAAIAVAGSAQATASNAPSGAASDEPAVITCPGTPAQCFADVAPGTTFFDYANHVYQQEIVTGYPCGGAGEPCDDQNRPYYRPGNQVTRAQMSKFVDEARRKPGINITGALTPADSPAINVDISGTNVAGIVSRSATWKGVVGISTSDDGVRGESQTWKGVVGGSDSNDGVFGGSNTGFGVYGLSQSNLGVFGESLNGDGIKGRGNGFGVVGEGLGGAFTAGVHGTSVNAFGVWGFSTNSQGVYGASTNGNAGYFQGNVTINGVCTGCFGPSRVDDPLDPANQYLFHSPVQSDDYTNIYNGNITLDANGEALVEMPEWFSAINSDFRYQLTAIGAPAPNLYIAEEVENNHFKIAGGAPGMKVSWQVTATRSDAFAQKNRVPVEQAKPADEQGLYLNPELYGQPESKGLGYEALQKEKQALESR
jgi:hypothetical protein